MNKLEEITIFLEKGKSKKILFLCPCCKDKHSISFDKEGSFTNVSGFLIISTVTQFKHGKAKLEKDYKSICNSCREKFNLVIMEIRKR